MTWQLLVSRLGSSLSYLVERGVAMSGGVVDAENFIHPGHSHVITKPWSGRSWRGFGRPNRDSGRLRALRDDEACCFDWRTSA